jgi:hypothetical protein
LQACAFRFFVVVICLYKILLTWIGVGGILMIQWAGYLEQGSTPSQDTRIISIFCVCEKLLVIPCVLILFKIPPLVSMEAACLRIALPRKVPKSHFKFTIIASRSIVLKLIGRHLIQSYMNSCCHRRSQNWKGEP